MANKQEFYVETDVETTGLHAHGGDLLLEIQVFISEPVYPYRRLEEEGFHAIIRQSRDEAYEQATGYVRRMHSKNNLWDKLEDGTPLEEVDENLLSYLKTYIPKGVGRVTGNSVRLDMSFIEKFLPRSAEWLHWRMLDISGIAFWANQEFGIPFYEKERAHTATGDINESMAELRHITSLLTKEMRDAQEELYAEKKARQEDRHQMVADMEKLIDSMGSEESNEESV